MGAILKFLSDFKSFIKGLFSEADGTPSSTRVLMYVFSGFALWLLWRIFWHVFRLTDTTQITIWLSNIPLLVTTLMGLIALPYTINKSAGAITETFSGLANMMASSKQVQVNAQLDGKIADYVKKLQGGNQPPDQTTVPPVGVAPATPAQGPAAGAVGSVGPKG